MLAKLPVSAKRRRRQSGATIVEFGLSLMPLLGFVFLILALSWVIFAWACIQEAVREGARTAVTCSSSTALNSTIISVVKQYSFGFVNSGNAANVVQIQYFDPTTLLPITGQVFTGDVVKVSISNLPVYAFAPIMRANSPIVLGAASSDIMSCPSPATP
jgi:Flp pilus assembly protein TadG